MANTPHQARYDSFDRVLEQKHDFPPTLTTVLVTDTIEFR